MIDKLTVGILRQLLADKKLHLPDDMLVGVTDHFGVFIPFEYMPEVETVSSEQFKRPNLEALVFPHIDIGEEPD